MAFGIYPVYAKEDKTITVLSKQVLEAKSSDALYAPFEQIADHYFKKNDYDGMVEFMKSLSNRKKALGPFTNYYTALARYRQMRYLEEAQKWDEYFAEGNNYRAGITEGVEKAIDSTDTNSPLRIKARFLAWQFHAGQQDHLSGSSLDELMADVMSFAKDSVSIKELKDVADGLNAEGEKSKARQVYKAYANKLITSAKDAKALEESASSFYKEGNLELAQNLYDAYLDRVLSPANKVQSAAVLRGLIPAFSYKDDSPCDAQYAEKLCARMEKLCGRDAFDEELNYLRAFNLEKSKDFKSAYDYYGKFAAKFPLSAKSDEADFKSGLISTYILRDIETGRGYFSKLAAKEALSPQVISALYHLGLLSQWQQDSVKAAEYYQKVIDLTKAGYQDTALLAQQRLKELSDSKEMDYNLKAFLDAALKPAALPDGQNVDFNIKPYIAEKSKDVLMTSQSNTSPSGCLQVELQYLWSGHLGKNSSPGSNPQFSTLYDYNGTKEAFLVVLSPTGIVGYALDIADVR